MRKPLFVSALALTLAGCAAQQAAPPPQVRDLSHSRERAAQSHYTVVAGDTLYGIAWRHGMDYRDLAQLNRIGPPYRIQPGQQLTLSAAAQAPRDASQASGPAPAASGATATALAGGTAGAADTATPDWLLPDEAAPRGETAGDTAPVAAAERAGAAAPPPAQAQDQTQSQSPSSTQSQSPAQSSAQSSAAAGEAAAPESESPARSQTPAAETAAPDAGTEVAGEPERRSAPAARSYTPVAEVPWQWPADGEVIGRFGEGESITAGIDIAGQKGQPVKAAGPGIVVYAGSGVRGYGNLVLIKHNDQYLSAYAHNQSLRVAENDVVEAGDVIASMGDSDAESVRLHFEVRKDGEPRDPLEYLPSR